MFKNIVIFSLLTVLSRLFGYCRDIIVAMVLGANITSDIFFAIFCIPNLFRRIVGEGGVAAAFTPLYHHHKHSQKFLNSAFIFTASLSFVVSLAAFIAMPWIVAALLPGFSTEDYLITVALARITITYVFFIGIATFFAVVLTAIERFILLAILPIIMNAILIIFSLFAIRESPLLPMAMGIAVAGVVQLIVSYCVFRQHFHITKGFKGLYMQAFAKRLATAVSAASLYPVNTFALQIVASFFVGAISYMYFADRLIQLPLALIGISVANVLLPKISKLYCSGQMKRGRLILGKAFLFLLCWAIPAAVGLAAHAELIIKLLFGYGNFDQIAIINTARMLALLSVTLVPLSCIQLFVSLLGAVNKMLYVTWLNILMIAINVVVCLILFKSQGFLAIGYANIISSYVVALLMLCVSYKLGLILRVAPVTNKACCFLLASLIALLVESFAVNLSEGFLKLAASIIIFLIVYLAALKLLLGYQRVKSIVLLK